jgi:hypothetical protein
VQTGVADTQDPFWDLEIVGDYAYTATYSSARVVDLSDPTSPVEVGSLGRRASGFAVSDGHIFLASSDAKLIAMDISDPASPSYRGRASLPDSARKVAVADDYAYVTVLNGGVHIVDVSNPSQMAVVGVYQNGENFSDVAASGNHLLVADFDGLHIVDVTDPSAPVRVVLYDIDGSVSSVDVSGSLAYLGVDPLTVVDFSDASYPIRVGSVNSDLAPGEPNQIKVVGDKVYLAHNIGGVSIVRGCHAFFADGFESGDTSAWSSISAREP